MPAYSFQERFVPMVLDGSKDCTIRGRRSKGFAKPGDTLYHYFGMRTKWCRKLREEKCTAVHTIIIEKDSIITIPRRLTDQEIADTPWNDIKEELQVLSTKEMNLLAWRDGFRPEGSTADNPKGAWQLMKEFWMETHTLPFIGDHIYWNPTCNKPSK